MRSLTMLVFVGFAHDRRLVGLVFVLFVFDLVIIVVGGISWWGRGACDGETLVDATCPLLLQTSVKLYGIHGHVPLLLTCVLKAWRAQVLPRARAPNTSQQVSGIGDRPEAISQRL